MFSHLFKSFCILIVLVVSCSPKEKLSPHNKLWFDTPADASVKDDPDGWKDDPEWLKALPLGNGSLGAMVFGGVNKERIQLNEESMWSGSPDDNDNPDAFAVQDEIRQLLFDGKYKEATQLTNSTQICKGEGSGHGNGAEVPFGCFQTLGDLWIDNDGAEPYENYSRTLNMNDAMVNISYAQKGVRFKRELFVSQPDQVLVVRFTADKAKQISFKATIDRPERFKTKAIEGQLVMTGALSNGKGGVGVNYVVRLKALNTGGSVKYVENKLVVDQADEVVLLLCAATDYKLEYPYYKGDDPSITTAANMASAVEKGYNQLLTHHFEEYRPYFSRVDFDITPEETPLISTNKRLEAYKNTHNDPHLEELMFQYGRYLLIASSRPGTLPANLQGIWANKIQTPWNGDYHTDVNVQMNYWPAETTNLSEMHAPLFNLISSLVQPGEKTAQTQYHSKGWVIHPITNVWGYTSPGESARWGMHTGAGAWICQHIMEHYRFTSDMDFLKEMYPVLKGSVQFYMDWLVKDPKTEMLVSGPAVSPENSFIAPDGSRSQISMGPAHDQQVIWQLFSDYLEASKLLEIQDGYFEKVETAKRLLLGPQVGTDGRLMEWAEEFPEVEPGHRHISHLFAVHPGTQINTLDTPDLVQAAKKSLDFRVDHGGGHTGWSAAWLINQYARLGDAEKAKKSLEMVLTKSTFPNLFGSHPPFQIDTNFGTTAGISEMLLQSHSGVIELLPALPQDWPSGTVKGLCARGGFIIDMAWQDGKLQKAKVFSKTGGVCKISYKGTLEIINTELGQIYVPFQKD